MLRVQPSVRSHHCPLLSFQPHVIGSCKNLNGCLDANYSTQIVCIEFQSHGCVPRPVRSQDAYLIDKKPASNFRCDYTQGRGLSLTCYDNVFRVNVVHAFSRCLLSVGDRAIRLNTFQHTHEGLPICRLAFVCKRASAIMHISQLIFQLENRK